MFNLTAYAADQAQVIKSDGTEGEIPIAWSPAAGTADFGTTYNAVITLTSANGFSNNLSIKLNGEELTDTNIKKPDDKTLVITKVYTTLKAKLLSIPTAELTVAHGTAMADIIAKPPTEINIVTENKAVSTASVEWNTDALNTSGYDPIFTVNGAPVAGIPIIVRDEKNNVVITGYTVSYAFKTGIPTQSIELDKENNKVYITSDKEYKNITVMLAAYDDNKLACIRFISNELDAGMNELEIPADFSSENANTVKVMIWNNFENMIPLFEAYEK